MTAALIGLDLGTTTVTGVLFDSEGRQLLRLARRRNDGALPGTPAGRAEQDPWRLRQRALEVLAELAEASEPVRGVALTGQKHGLLCIAADGDPLTPLITWQDQRTAEPLAGGTTTLERLRERLVDLDWRDNGCRIQHGYGGATLFWLAQQSILPRATQHVCTIASWLAGQLTDEPPVSDPTFAASWGIYDVVRDSWNSSFLARMGLDPGILPPVWHSGEPVGRLGAEVAQQVGLDPGLPVYNALGDTQASFLGSTCAPAPAVCLRDTVLINLGTGGQVCWAVPAFELPTEQVETRPLPGKGFLRVGASLAGGEAYAWLNRTVLSWLAAFDVQTEEESVYDRLNRLAASVEDAGKLHVRTTFLGVRGDPAVKAGSIEGIPVEGMDLGALARATLQGIVDELHNLYVAQGGLEGSHGQVITAGGTVERNPLLLELIGQRFGLPVLEPPCRESAAAGAAMFAGESNPGPG